MILSVLGVLIIAGSGALGMWLEITGRMKRPAYFWFLGAYSMLVGIALIALGTK